MFPVTEVNNISIICSVQYSFPEIPLSCTVNKNHLIFCSVSIKKVNLRFQILLYNLCTFLS